MIERQVKLFPSHKYFVMWERVGFFYMVTYVLDHNTETGQRTFLNRAKSLDYYYSRISMGRWFTGGWNRDVQ